MVICLELHTTIRIASTRDSRQALQAVQDTIYKALKELSLTDEYLLDTVSTYIEESPFYHGD
jgi:hypothetical protein